MVTFTKYWGSKFAIYKKRAYLQCGGKNEIEVVSFKKYEKSILFISSIFLVSVSLPHLHSHHSPPDSCSLNLKAMASMAARQFFNLKAVKFSPLGFFPRSPVIFISSNKTVQFLSFGGDFSSKLNLTAVPKASPDGILPIDDEDGVSLGTLKLPSNTDLSRFEALLFQVL